MITKTDKRKYHTKFVCPKLHYLPLKGISILKSIRNQGGIEQKRDEKYFRKKKRLSTSLISRKPFFKVYEEARNFATKKRIKEEKE